MKCAVLGDPVDHSLSPVLHRAAYDALGLDWSYSAERVGSRALPAFLAGLDDDWRGLSLTMPLKRAAMALVDDVSPAAALVGATNTLVFVGGGDGGVQADNTDLPGAVAALQERYAGPLTGATILGAGATAASLGLALCELGATTITLLVRSPERAVETVAAISRHSSRPEVLVGALAEDRPHGQILVSTIPAAAQTPFLVTRCAEAPVVFEVLYDPWPTPLAGAAVDRVLVSGLDLLVHQAALQVEIFTGMTAPLAAMRAAGEAALAEREGRG